MKAVNKFLFLTVTILAVLYAVPSFAAKNVSVTIPTFTVTLNGEKMENKYAQYPLIVYKNITYVPMTYYHARFLGLETDWSSRNNTFKVYTVGKSSGYLEKYTTSSPNNSKSYTAAIAEYKISVNNGDFLNNSYQDYPILNFRGVTYFPMTWKYAHDSFGWDYSFSSASGLVINCSAVNMQSFIGEWNLHSYLYMARDTLSRVEILSVDEYSQTIKLRYKFYIGPATGGLGNGQGYIDNSSYGDIVTLSYSWADVRKGERTYITESFTMYDRAGLSVETRLAFFGEGAMENAMVSNGVPSNFRECSRY